MVFFVFTSIILLLLLGLSFYFLKEKNELWIVLFLSLVYAVWLVSNYLYPRTSSYSEALIFSKLLFSSTAMLFWGMLLMSVYYPNKIKNQSLITFAWLYGIIAFLEAYYSQFTDSVISKLIYKTEIHQYIFQFNIPVFAHYILYTACTVGCSLFILNRRYRRSTGKELLQLKYMYWGLSISAIAAGTTNMILPMFFNIFQYSDFGTFLGTIFLVVILYTIAIGRLYDLQFIITKLFYWVFEIFITLISFLGGYIWIFYLLDNRMPPLTDSVIFLTILLSSAVTLTIRILGDRATPWEEAKGKIFSELETTVATELDVEKLCAAVSKSIQKLLNVDSSAIILLDKDRKRVSYKDFRNFKNKETIQFDDLLEILVYWKEKGEDPIMLFDELAKHPNNKRLSDIREVMKKHDIKVIAPLNRRVVLNGLILLGEKIDSLPFTIQDTDLIEKTIRIASVALGRALLYEEVHQFSNTLQHKVDESTIELHETISNLNLAQLEVKKKNSELKSALDELKTLDKAKSEFISIASHQLRTPISIIKGYLSMILDGDFGGIPTEATVAVKKASSNIQQLNDIVEDILNASRIEKGKLFVNPERTELVELGRSVVSQLLPKAKQKNLTLEFKTTSKEFYSNVDRNKIYEVIVNLVDNAINYTKEGGISVKVGEQKNSNFLISVTDTGIGIPDEFVPKMFKRFSRSENARLVRPDGTGIGLYVVKAFIDAHKGKIWFETKINEGTTFFVELPKSDGNEKTE